MVASNIPYFHNNPGAPRVLIRVKEFMCVGDLPPFDHPHVYIDMGDDDEIVCPYCSALFVYDAGLQRVCEPAECEFHPQSVPELVPPESDISILTAPLWPLSISAARPQASAARAASVAKAGAGIVAAFESEEALRRALEQLRAEKSAEVQTYTPKALAESSANSLVPLAMLAAGLLGASAAFVMETLANVSAYPLDIGGRPKFSWPSFVPIAFEIGVLCAMLSGFFGYLIAVRMPKLYDPIDEYEPMQEAMRDGWLLAIRAGDGEALEQAREVLESLHPKRIEDISL
jgi:uncharacterized Zn-finger protein